MFTHQCSYLRISLNDDKLIQKQYAGGLVGQREEEQELEDLGIQSHLCL